MNRGLTIIEIIIAIGISILLLTIVGLPFKRMNETQVLSKEMANVMGVLNNTRSMSVSSKGGVAHGVHLSTNEVVVFSGETYSESDPNNVSIPLHSLVNISNISLTGGTSNIIFDQLTGETSSTGTITLSLVASSTQTKIITVRATGLIDGTP